MFEKVKAYVSDHREGIRTVLIASFAAAVATKVLSRPKLPNHIVTTFFEHGGKVYMMLNGRLYVRG